MRSGDIFFFVSGEHSGRVNSVHSELTTQTKVMKIFDKWVNYLLEELKTTNKIIFCPRSLVHSHIVTVSRHIEIDKTSWTYSRNHGFDIVWHDKH